MYKVVGFEASESFLSFFTKQCTGLVSFCLPELSYEQKVIESALPDGLPLNIPRSRNIACL